MRMPNYLRRELSYGMIDAYDQTLRARTSSVTLQFYAKVFSGKLKSRSSGPYTVTNAVPHGAIEIRTEKNGNQSKVNGHRLKNYHGGEVTQITSSTMSISK